MHTESYQELLLQAKADALTNLGFRPDALAHGGRVGEEVRLRSLMRNLSFCG
jgi:hypothetical protein